MHLPIEHKPTIRSRVKKRITWFNDKFTGRATAEELEQIHTNTLHKTIEQAKARRISNAEIEVIADRIMLHECAELAVNVVGRKIVLKSKEIELLAKLIKFDADLAIEGKNHPEHQPQVNMAVEENRRKAENIIGSRSRKFWKVYDREHWKILEKIFPEHHVEEAKP